MKDIDKIKDRIKEIIYKKLSNFKDIVSVTLPGSFQQKDNISIISDIDVVIIVENLHKQIFDKIVNSFKISGDDFFLPNYSVKINSSFGPLKFDSDKVIVFHLMIYDIMGHRNHVIKSPFTCNDWEKTLSLYGKNLNKIYPSHPLQFEDLLLKRRGIDVYIKDLDKKAISYRKYLFENERVKEVKMLFSLDNKLKKEYAFHIIKYLILNTLKILEQKNLNYSEIELIQNFNFHTNKFDKLLKLFRKLYDWKYNYGIEPFEINKIIKPELKVFNKWYSNLIDNLPKVTFVRHAKTNLNDGSFLGIRRNPDILSTGKFSNINFDKVYSGTLKRTDSTSKLFNSRKYIKTDLINEIDYGDVEGLTFNELKKTFPNIIKEWNKKKDPKFPNGENYNDVINRLNLFLEKNIYNSNDKNICVVTHNVVIRVLLGMIYNVEKNLFHLFKPEHLEFISFRIYGNIIIPNLTNDQRIKFRDQYIKWN